MNQYTLPHQHNQYIPEIKSSEITANTFKQVSTLTSIHIFLILCHCEECVIDISSMMERNSPAVTHHLRLLLASNLIIFCIKRGEQYE